MNDDMLFPTNWPKALRRAFVLTIPISGPIWVACVMMIGVAALCIFAAYMIAHVGAAFIYELWTGHAPNWKNPLFD